MKRLFPGRVTNKVRDIKMVTRPTSKSKKDDNKAIYEILLKILDKWRTGPESIEAAVPKDFHQNTVDDSKESAGFSDEEIVMETVLLRPEDFQTDYPAQAVQEYSTIPETGFMDRQVHGEDLNSETIEQAEEDIPKTVIQELDILKTEASFSGPHEMEIPETVIFSPKGTRDASITPDQTTSAVCESDQKKQESLKSVNESEKNDVSSNKNEKNETVPETIIFRGKTDNDK